MPALHTYHLLSSADVRKRLDIDLRLHAFHNLRAIFRLSGVSTGTKSSLEIQSPFVCHWVCSGHRSRTSAGDRDDWAGGRDRIGAVVTSDLRSLQKLACDEAVRLEIIRCRCRNEVLAISGDPVCGDLGERPSPVEGKKTRVSDSH